MLNFFKIREICDENPIYSNTSFSIKLARIFIRVTQNIFNLSLALKILLLFDKLLNFFFHIVSPVRYIIILNSFRLSYLLSLSKNNLHESIDKKIKWSEFVIKESSCINCKINSRAFIELVQKDNFFEDQSVYDLKKFPQPKFQLETNFLVIGPTYKNTNYENKDFSLIHLKPFSSDLNGFKEKILIINSFYYRKKVMNDVEFSKLLTETYDFIFVSCNISELPKGFYRLPGMASGNIASPMGLQRALFFLKNSSPANKKIRVLIDGFDLYLSKNPYTNLNYEKLTRKDNSKPMMDEKEMCRDIAHHDFAYNFCFLKKISLSFDIMGSSDFKDVLSKPLHDYIKKLSSERDFTKLA